MFDGCALACAKNCLARHGIAPTQYHQLQQYGVKKRYHADFDPAQAEEVIAEVGKEIATLATKRKEAGDTTAIQETCPSEEQQLQV